MLFRSEDILKTSGFTHNFFYYPMPDYRIVEEVFSDEYLPVDEWGLGITPYYGEYMDSLMTIEKIQYKELFRNEIFDVFANSFLVEASEESERFCDIVYAKTNFDRKKPFRTSTTISSNNIVRKSAIADDALTSLDNCILLAKKINNRHSKYIRAVEISKDGNEITMPFIREPNLLKEMLKAIEKGDNERFSELLELYYRALCDSSEVVEESSVYGTILKELYIEMTPSNCFIENEDKLVVFDLEKSVDNMPANFMLFRTLEYFEGLKRLYAWRFSFEYYIDEFGLRDLWDEYSERLQEYYSELTYLDNNPHKSAQIFDIERMRLNAEFIAHLGMDSLRKIDEIGRASCRERV